MKIQDGDATRRRMQSSIADAIDDPRFILTREHVEVSDICRNLLMTAGYEDIVAGLSCRVTRPPPKGRIVVCSDASVHLDLPGIAGIGFIAYTERGHHLVGYGQAMLRHRLGRQLSSHTAETVGMAVAAYAMRGFTGSIMCDNTFSVGAFNAACRHAGIGEMGVWGKGHADSLGNRMADSAAKKALRQAAPMSGILPSPVMIKGNPHPVETYLAKKTVPTLRHTARIDTASRIVTIVPGVAPTELRTVLVHAPSLESAGRHLFMILGLHNHQLLQVETGTIVSEVISDARAGWIRHVPAIFTNHLRTRYPAVAHVSVSRLVEKAYDHGIRLLDRGHVQNATAEGQADIEVVTSLFQMIRSGTRFSTECALRGEDCMAWDDALRKGTAQVKAMRKCLARSAPVRQWRESGLSHTKRDEAVSEPRTRKAATRTPAGKAPVRQGASP